MLKLSNVWRLNKTMKVEAVKTLNLFERYANEATMRPLLVLFLLMISLSANGTVFTIGTGESWRDICSGKHDELDEKGSIAACTIFLLGYQMGAVEQARKSNTEPSLCRSLNPNTLPAEFIAFVSSKKEYEKMDVLGVLLAFTRGNMCNA